MRRAPFLLGLAALLTTGAVATVATVATYAPEARKATLYKNPQCSCCEGYADYLRGNGFDVTVKPTHDLATISTNAGVPERLQGCHSMFIDGYVIDGHVPVDIVRRLLSERPKIAGITLPGMPAGSPGMVGAKTAPFVVYALPKDGGAPTVYAKE
ncbi:MAG: CopG family transcriptional regulator [Rhodospirillales bacterium]|nr:CopG family transcriptional regulator [Rhodospirillales bacterium]